MTLGVRDWLPVNVVDRPAVRTVLADAVAEWSQEWFAKRSVEASNFRPQRQYARVMADVAWRVHRTAVAVSCSRRSTSRLIDWALDARLELISLTETDQRLIDAFERRLIDDFVLRIEQALGLSGESLPLPRSVDNPLGALGGLLVGIADQQGFELMSLAIPLEALLPLCRSSMSRAQSDVRPLSPLSSVLGDTAVSFEASLGHANLSFADLRDLAPGDVLVLDTATNGLAELSVRGHPGATFARARLSDLDGDLALTLHA